MEIKDTITRIHDIAKDKGFWDNPRNIGELLMLVTSELSEALEADRKDRRVNKSGLNRSGIALELLEHFVNKFEENIKDTFEDEIADAVIRLFDICGGLNIDLEYHIQMKMAYNGTRQRLHGKKY